MRDRLYLDMRLGVSGDMIVSACYDFMEERMRSTFYETMKGALDEFGGRTDIVRIEEPEATGHRIEWNMMDPTEMRNPSEARDILESIEDMMGLSEASRAMADKTISDLIDAESKAHNVPQDRVHLHEVGRIAGLMNIAGAGLCYDLLGLSKKKMVGSIISIGEGEVETSHGLLSVPAPATANLLLGLRFRFGPHLGEMATPTGVALARNIIRSQEDPLPLESRQGLGFGSRSFSGRRGYVRLFSGGCDIIE